jgi:hypothetical protein
MKTVDIPVPTRQIRKYSTPTDSNAIRHTASAKCSTDANRLSELTGTTTVSLGDNLRSSFLFRVSNFTVNHGLCSIFSGAYAFGFQHFNKALNCIICISLNIQNKCMIS